MKTTMWAALGLGLVLACGACGGNDDKEDKEGSEEGASSGAAAPSSASNGSSGAPPASSSSGAAPVANDASPLVVRAASERTRLGARTVRNGSFFAVVEVSVKNATRSSFAFSLGNFRVVAAGLEVVAAPDTIELADACPTAGFLTAGATIACSVAFELTDLPERIVLASVLEGSLEPLRLEAAVPSFQRCERCGEDACVDLQTSDEHCGACDRPVPPEADACVDGTVRCQDDGFFCDGKCGPKHPERLRECSNVRVVELERRDTSCSAACAPNACIGGNAGYGLVGLWLDVGCDEPPPETTDSPFGSELVAFRWLDCFCSND